MPHHRHPLPINRKKQCTQITLLDSLIGFAMFIVDGIHQFDWFCYVYTLIVDGIHQLNITALAIS